MLYDDTIITEKEYNKTIDGLNNSYKFLSVLPNLSKKYLKGKNILCMASSTNITASDNFVENFTHIGFYEDVQEFFNIDDWTGTHSMYFKEIEDVDNVETIIEDIKSHYKDSLINK